MNVQEILQQQLEFNKVTYAKLVDLGLKPETKVQLDFTYDSPTKEGAEKLSQFLYDQTDYEVGITSAENQWQVTGHTQPTAISLEILNQWVDWMVTAGAAFQSEFDGWGTSI